MLPQRIEEILEDSMDKFGAWLLSKPDGSVVGEARHGCCCPLANFFNEVYGLPEGFIFDVSVGMMLIISAEGKMYIKMKRWMTVFVEGTDAGNTWRFKVTKEQALFTLKMADAIVNS